MSEPQFGRLITAMITPFDENRDIDLKRTDEFVNRLIEGGTDSIIVCGTTGEAAIIERRSFIGVEHNANYFTISAQRLHNADSKPKQLSIFD